jgi:hypothetical protein
MAVRPMRVVRLLETRRQYRSLRAEIDGWYGEWKNRDKELGAHRTQLDTLKGVLDNAMARLETELEKLEAQAAQTPSGQIYAACRAHDQYLIWVRSIWDYFRVKFDQRSQSNDPEQRQLLVAADEVIWSCYAPVFRRNDLSKRGATLRAAPLACLDTFYSPSALTRDSPGVLRAADVDPRFKERLKGYLASLPVPVIRLPFRCIETPWWLIILGHESGHQVARDLPGGRNFVASFGARLEACVKASPDALADDDAAGWARWGEEIFADLHSVFRLGCWAARAMAELVRDTPEAMLQSEDPAYPPAVVRLALMDALHATLMGNPWAPPTEEKWITWLGETTDAPEATSAFLEADPEVKQSLLAHLRQVPKVVEMIQKQPLVSAEALNALRRPEDTSPSLTEDLFSLAEICGWELAAHQKLFRPGGEVELWRDMLTGRSGPRMPQEGVAAVRAITCASLAAYLALGPREAIAGEENEAPGANTDETLAQLTLDTITENAERDTRAASAATTADVEGFGEELAALLLSAETPI